MTDFSKYEITELYSIRNAMELLEYYSIKQSDNVIEKLEEEILNQLKGKKE